MAENCNRGGNTWVAGAGLGLFTVNSGLAIYRAKGDLGSILFVSGSYITLLLLFACLRAYERAPPGSPARERARRAVWALTTALTVGFAWKVSAFLASAVPAAAGWYLAIATTAAGGFFALFVFVTVFYVDLVLLFACLRAYERAPTASPARERARRAVWAVTTLLTWKVAAVMPFAAPATVVWDLTIATTAGGLFALFLFLSVSYLALALLFACLRAYERAPPGSAARERARRAVWAHATGLTLAFSWKVAAFMPWAVPAAVVWDLTIATTAGGFFALFLFVSISYLAFVLLFVCLREYERAAPALMMVAFSAVACDAALAIHDALGDHLCSPTFVLVAYAGLLVLTFRFLGAFAGRER